MLHLTKPRNRKMPERGVDPLFVSLRARRMEIGLTQEALARKSGIPSSTIRRAERGRISPMFFTVRVWAQALGMKLEVTK